VCLTGTCNFSHRTTRYHDFFFLKSLFLSLSLSLSLSPPFPDYVRICIYICDVSRRHIACVFSSSLSVDFDFLHHFIHSILSPRLRTFVQDGRKASSLAESAMYIFISRWPSGSLCSLRFLMSRYFVTNGREKTSLVCHLAHYVSSIHACIVSIG
jgi:hypothetical protein